MEEEFWREVQDLISTIHGNLGICCQEQSDAPEAIWALEQLQERIVDLREKIEGN